MSESIETCLRKSREKQNKATTTIEELRKYLYAHARSFRSFLARRQDFAAEENQRNLSVTNSSRSRLWTRTGSLLFRVGANSLLAQIHT
jgi:hypothetical protein